MALFGGTTMPVTELTIRLTRASCVVSMPVFRPNFGARVASVITTSSSERVARALADAVDGHLGLARAGEDARQGVRRREPEVVVAVHRDDDALDAGHVVADAADEGPELVGRGVTDGVGDVERGRARRGWRASRTS